MVLTRSGRKRKSDADNAVNDRPTTLASKPKKQRTLPVRKKDSQNEEESTAGYQAEDSVLLPEKPTEELKVAPTGAKMHKFFADDDEEITTPPVSTTPAAAVSSMPIKAAAKLEIADSDEESDDDAPPEAISTHDAAEQAKKAKQAAADAVEQYATPCQRI
jgi:hypothetical protein